MTPLLINRILLAILGLALVLLGWAISGVSSSETAKPQLPSAPAIASVQIADAVSPAAIRNKQEQIQASSGDTSGDLEIAGRLWQDNPAWTGSLETLAALVEKIDPPDARAAFDANALLASLRSREHSAFVDRLATALAIPAPPDSAALAALRRQLEDFSTTAFLEKLAMEISARLSPPAASRDSAAPMAGTDKEFTLSGIGFVWVGEGGSGFWVSREEMGSGSSPPSAASLRTRIEGQGIPASWTVGLPTLAQWQAARAASQSLGLADFDGGRAEFLSDGRVIGASSFSSAAATRNPATIAERRKLTRRLVTAAQLPSPGRSTGSPAVYSEETDFAHRIVISPR